MKDLRPKLPEVLSEAFHQLLTKMWATNPEERPGMAAVLDELDGLQGPPSQSSITAIGSNLNAGGGGGGVTSVSSPAASLTAFSELGQAYLSSHGGKNKSETQKKDKPLSPTV